ncbi:MAG TPA: hypothetical protein VK911_04525 [Vicinamibacterales bacterium]|nr:hypothetical protein [Vicinamibacterales bacterium]
MTAYPFEPEAPSRKKDVPATPGRLWKRIPLDRRTEAAAAFWEDEEGAEQQAEALLAIASHFKLRLKTARSLPRVRKVRYLASLPGLSDAVAGRVLVSYHLRHRRPMLASFLDALGIAHDNGVLSGDDLTAPDAARLQEAAAKLRAEHPKEDVDLYFQTLLVQDPDTWGGLAPLLEEGVEPDHTEGGAEGQPA